MFSIEISKKSSIKDAEGSEVLRSILNLHIQPERVLVNQFYMIEGTTNMDELRKIAGDLLIDPVIEESSIQLYSQPVQKKYENTDTGSWEILKLFHFGVTDNVGETTLKAIHDAGINSATHVMTGKKYLLIGSLTYNQAKDISTRILSNPIMETCLIRKIK